MSSDYVIWSLKQHAWFAPQAGGYVRDFWQAGRFEPTEAVTIVGERNTDNVEELALPRAPLVDLAGRGAMVEAVVGAYREALLARLKAGRCDEDDVAAALGVPALRNQGE